MDTNRPFQFHKRRQLFIRTHNETLSVVAMCVCNAIDGIAPFYCVLASVWKTSSHFPLFFTQMLPLLYVPDMSLPSEV